MKLPTQADIEAKIYDPEFQARVLVTGLYIVLGMTVLGYVIMAYLLFFNN